MTDCSSPLSHAVAVIILTWNGLEYTQSCLDSIRRNTLSENVQIIVVDNGSTDGTVSYLRSLTDIRLIENKENLGFSRGNNRALRSLAETTDALLVNNDVEIHDPLWIEKLQDTAYQSERYGIVGCRIRHAGSDAFQHAGTYMPDQLFQGIQVGGGEKDINQFNNIDGPVEGVVFACAYIKSKLIKEIGFLDEDYFAYYEDTDYCLKAKAAGYETVVCGDLTVLHHQNTSTAINNVSFNQLYRKSKTVFLSKWRGFLEDRFFSDINLITTFSRPVGYASQGRLIAKALEFNGIKVHYGFAYGRHSVVPIDEPADVLTGDYITDVIRSRPPQKGIPNLFYCQADAFSPIPGEYNIGYSMLETTGLPQSWVDACNKMDEIWVPTPFNVWSFKKSGVIKPIRQVPLGIDIHYFNPDIHAYPLNDFTFLSIFEWGERKAPEVLIKTFNAAFRAEEPVVLICKYLNMDPHVDPKQIIHDLNLDPKGGRIVFSENALIPYHQIAQLYCSADCFVLPTRGEGWGVPILEAMACGLPVIASYWSGPQYFMTDDISYPLQVSLIPANARCPYYDGFQWAEPDSVHLHRLLRHVFENQREAARKGSRAKEFVQKYWDVNLMGLKIVDGLIKSKSIRRVPLASIPEPNPRIAIDISRTIGSQVTGVGQYTLRLIKGISELEESDIPYRFELLPGFGDYVHPDYPDTNDYTGPVSSYFTVHRGPAPSFSTPDHYVPGMSLVHCTSNVFPDIRDTPALFTVHDLTFLTHKAYHTQETIDNCCRNFDRAIDKAAHFAANSHHTAKDLIRYLGVPEDKITVVECGVPQDHFRPVSLREKNNIRRLYNLPDTFFLYVGSIEPRKNILSLLGAMEHYKGPEKLVVAGASGWKNDTVLDKMAASGDCIFLGYIPDASLPALFSAASVFIYPSLYEGFGFPIIEAMACGVPVISSNTSSMKEIAENAAILIDDPEDDSAILSELNRITEDGDLKNDLIVAGRERVKKYTVKNMAIKMLSLYSRLIG